MRDRANNDPTRVDEIVNEIKDEFNSKARDLHKEIDDRVADGILNSNEGNHLKDKVDGVVREARTEVDESAEVAKELIEDDGNYYNTNGNGDDNSNDDDNT